MTAGLQLENGTLYANSNRPLPQELLSEIFSHCIQTSDFSEKWPTSKSAPLTLTWVCRNWRNLVISQQRFWTTISLGEYGSNPANDAQLFDLWIQRAGNNRSLNIKLCHEMDDSKRPVFFEPERGEQYIVGMHSLMKKMTSVQDRWHTIDLHALDLYVLEPILRALLSGAPRLKSLSISTKYFNFYGSVYFVDLSHCPSLQNLRLLSPTLSPPAATTSNTAANMKSLELRCCQQMQDCLTWLEICPNLESLDARLFRTTSVSLYREQGLLMMSRLTRLHIASYTDDADPNLLLDLLDLPALRDLSLDMNGLLNLELEESWSNKILRLIKRSKAPLEKLSLIGTPMTTHTLMQLMERTPYLKELVLSGAIISDELIESLHLRQNTKKNMSIIHKMEDREFDLCPTLEFVEFREFQCSLEPLVSMIHTRCRTAVESHNSSILNCDGETSQNTGYLKKLNLIMSPHPTLLSHTLIRECTMGGLKIKNRSINLATTPEPRPM